MSIHIYKIHNQDTHAGKGYFHKFFMANLTGDQLLTANFILEIIRLRDGRYCLSNGVRFSTPEFDDLICFLWKS